MASTRTFKAGFASLGGSTVLGGASALLGGVTDQIDQITGLASASRQITDALGVPLWALAAGVILIAGIGYMLWDRRFIYRNEGL